MAVILIVGLHVYLMEKITKLLEEEGHFVIGVFSLDMVRYNLRSRQFDLVLISSGFSKSFVIKIREAVEMYQQHCTIMDAVYDRDPLLAQINAES